MCVNTYGSYRCRTNKRCSRGYEPNEDGTACVGKCGPATVQEQREEAFHRELWKAPGQGPQPLPPPWLAGVS